MLARRLRPSLQGDGISAAKLSVIGQLYRVGPMTPTELAAREGVKLPSLTRLVAELEDDGWLARKSHISDGRRSLLGLTALGKKRLVAAAQAADAPLADAIANTVSADERVVLQQACALLERIGAALGGHAENASPQALGHTKGELFVPGNPLKFENTSLSGAQFKDVNLRSARFDDVNLADASFSNVALAGATFDDVNFSNVAITDSNLAGMTINGIHVSELLRGYGA